MRKYSRNISIISLCAALIYLIAACENGSTPASSGNTTNSPSEVILNSSSLTLLVGDTATLTAAVLPADAANKTVLSLWSPSTLTRT